MHVYKNTKSLLNLPAVTDAKPSYAKSKGLDRVLQPVSLMRWCNVCRVSQLTRESEFPQESSGVLEGILGVAS